MDLKKTSQFMGKIYAINNYSGAVLQAGDWVIVHPSETSSMQSPYLARVVIIWWEWAEEPSYELSIIAMNGFNYTACINDYMFNRLEKFEWSKNHFEEFNSPQFLESPKIPS